MPPPWHPPPRLLALCLLTTTQATVVSCGCQDGGGAGVHPALQVACTALPPTLREQHLPQRTALPGSAPRAAGSPGQWNPLRCCAGGGGQTHRGPSHPAGCVLRLLQRNVCWGIEGDGTGRGTDPRGVLQCYVPNPTFHIHLRAGAQPEQCARDTGGCLPASDAVCQPRLEWVSFSLQIPEIIHFCCDFLMSWVDEENILDVYRLAELFDLSRLTEQLDTYILKNFVAFSRTDKYRQLPLEKVYSLLSSNRLEVSCETEVYEGALLYHYSLEQVQADQISLHEPPKLLETVRFPLMEAEVLQRLHDKLDPSPLRDTVASALMYHRNESLQPSLQSPQTELRSDFQCVVGFGGIHSTPSTVLSDQAKYLNPLLGEWKHFTASLAPRMSNQGIAVLNNFVYLIGGDNNVQGFRAESRCWRYDPRHNRWFQIQSLQQEHADLSVCVVGRYIYAVAGRDYHNDLNAVERYDPATNSWAYVAPLKREVYAHAGATLEGKMYITCGRRGEDYLKETHCYDPGSNTWHTLADGPVRRAWHGMATLLNKLYVIGGSNNDAGYRRDVHQVACYSCTSGQWSSVCPLPAGHGEPGIAVLDNRIYVLGGRSHNRGSRTGYVHIYDVEKDCWEEGPQLDNSISGLAACVLTLPRSLLLEPPRGTPDRSQADPDFASEVMSVSDWEEFDNSSED
ncbi:kelch-like protein 22 isoform X1 [Nomascus leucogenys]|uniref:kelch-like protein 22 isoform X1 n=1 Tax=Nomascus leucogenys TaxID=61853 RepID=UPI00122DADD0|nr:kelch-like protein 22 isoform X1 [Nomascus leucogenys]